MSKRRPRRSAGAVLFIPLAIAVAVLVGLGAGLLGDAGWDWLAWAGLAVPVVVLVARRGA